MLFIFVRMGRKFLRISLLVIFLAALIRLVFYLMPDKRINGMYLIPSDAIYIIESEQPLSSWKLLSSSKIWGSVKDHASFESIEEDADYLDKLLQDNSYLLKLFGERQFYLSTHKTTANDFDFLYLVDLRKSAQRPILYTALEKVLRGEGFEVTRREHASTEILEVRNDKSVLSLCKIDNFLVCSYTPQLVESAIRQKNNPFFGIDYQFQEVFKEVSTKGAGRIYVQWSKLDDYLKCYFSNPDKLSADLDEALLFSALDLRMEENVWELIGYTSVNQGRRSYLRALSKAGKSEHRLPGILSNRTAWYTSFNFRSMQDFYRALRVELEQYPATKKEFDQNIDKVENLLDIEIDKHFVDWIGNEVGVAQLQSSGYTNQEEDLAIFLKMRDKPLALKRLHEISEQVRKKTPAKFKDLEYRSYRIRYLAIKGFFNALFGKAFEKLEKPHYTIIDEYVVFSNSPITLIGLIEDFEANRILQNTPAYQSIRTANKTSSLNAFVAPPVARKMIATHMRGSSRQNLNKSAEQIDRFGAFALDLRAEGDVFTTRLRIVQIDELDSMMTRADVDQLYRSYAVDHSINEEFVLEYVEDGEFKQFFPGGEKIKILANMEDGQLHGRYEEFYPTGELHIKGKYKNGKKSGIWKFYSTSGALARKERF